MKNNDKEQNEKSKENEENNVWVHWHSRRQPYGPGRKKVRMIRIEGYNRRKDKDDQQDR